MNIQTGNKDVKSMLTMRKIVIGVMVFLAALFAVPGTFMMFEELDASQIMVVQIPFTGALEVYTEPGTQLQWFGKVTKYPRQAQYHFCSEFDANGEEVGACVDSEGNVADSRAIRMRFSEGGHAKLNGAVNWVMPIDKDSIIKTHKKFGSAEAVETRAVSKMLDAAIYLAGPLMTSTESSGARRGELVHFIDDQAEHGVYVTKSTQKQEKDATGAIQTVTVTDIIEENGQPKRQQGSILEEFNITLLPISINELKYDRIVEQQIADRQKSTTDVQLSIAASVKAEQDAKTTESQGKAKAAEAKWAQETIKAKAVVEAQQKFEVATLAAKEAEQYKRQQILIGEGNATKMRLEMQANGALEQKLATYQNIMAFAFEAVGNYKGNWVPTTVVGGDGKGTSTNGASQMIELLTVKAAKDLSLDMSMKGK